MDESSVDDIVARIEEAKPYRHLGSRVIMPSDELDALVDSWRKQRAVLLQLQQSLPDEMRDLGFRGRIAAALATEPASDGAIYAARLRSLDPEAYDRLLDEIKASAAEAEEACARIAESFMDGSSHATLVAGTIAAAIRARTP